MEYIVTLTQTGATAPTENIWTNTLGGPITWTRLTYGLYQGQGVVDFTTSNTHILSYATSNGSILLAGVYIDSGNIIITCGNEDAVNIINLHIRYK